MTSATWYSIKNPTLAGELVDPDRHPFYLVERGGKIDLDFYDREAETRVRQTRADYRQATLDLLDQLEDKGEAYLHRSRARNALARYLRDVVSPAFPWVHEYTQLADALEQARQHGLWGVGDRLEADGLTLSPALALEWTGRVGQVKLCPDDAREESMRASSVYTPRLEEMIAGGAEVRYAVFTIPNSPMGFLRADLDAIFDRFKREILFARTDGRMARSVDDKKRTFATLRGALATVEAPLSRRGDWNVHLNVLMVFSDRPDYRALREAWGANIEFKTVPTGAGAAALRELVKYPLKAVSLKSEEKAASGRTTAPPVIEWPADAFHEWWRAHKGYRRTRSWGELYAGRLEEPDRQRVDKFSIEWLGRVFLSPSGFRAERPMMDTRHLDERQAAAYGLERDRRQAELWSAPAGQGELLDQLTDWTATPPATSDLDLILGNKSAAESPKAGADPPFS